VEECCCIIGLVASNKQQEIQVTNIYVIKLWCNLLGSSKSIEVGILVKSLNGLEWIVRQFLQGVLLLSLKTLVTRGIGVGQW
jgi:hypothetical protein